MRRILAAVGAFVVMLIPAANANASETNKCCADGKVPSAAAQKAVCKGLSGKTYTTCRTLAKLPEWWMATNIGNTHVESGPVLIRNLRKVTPVKYLRGEFQHNIDDYRSQHAHVGPGN